MKYDLEHEDLISIIKSADENELEELCSDIREFLIQKVSKTGGHLASNLGVVELTVAMHKVYNSPVDKIIYDVGHQTYVHKILTGRADQFDKLRKFKGLSGFPKAYESVHDAYDTGHSSTSLGAAAGYAVARNLKGEESEVVALIGDGAMTGGLVYEALNNIGSNRLKIRIILNDNGMSIAHNVGAMSKHLQRLRSSSNYINAKKSVRSSLNRVPLIGKPISNGISRTKSRIKLSVLDQRGILFEELGIKYIGPIDGYDIPKLIEAFNAANAVEGPTIVHVITTKGKGYSWSEKFPRKFHGVGPFSIDDGNLLSSNNSSSEVSFSEVFGNKLLELAKEDDRIVAITAAMGTATGLGPFCDELPNRFFDVGIAEQHAVLFAAGLAKAGMIPVAPIYSSFLQRAYDQIIEDVYGAVVHIIEKASLYGGDSSSIFLTGDSAGGHLCASVANFIDRIGNKGFNKLNNTFQFLPTYMPKGKSIEEIKQKLAQSIKGVAPSYGVFSTEILSQRFTDYPFLSEVAPINYIPEDRAVPHFLLRGSEDKLIKNEEVENYAKALIKAGQRVEYLQVGGADHAFLDWKPDEETQETFNKYGKYYTKHMLLFFDDILGK